MASVNYIKHINAFQKCLKKETIFSATDVSLYYALFSEWNSHLFANPFSVYREDLLRLSKLSVNTYYKSLEKLRDAGYILYQSDLKRYKPISITMFPLDVENRNTNTENGSVNIETPLAANLPNVHIKNDTLPVLKKVHLIKQINKNSTNDKDTTTKFIETKKDASETLNPEYVLNLGHTKKNDPPTFLQIEMHFKEMKYPGEEAAKFFEYNQNRKWLQNGKFRVNNWKNLAEMWINHCQKSHFPTIEATLEDEITFLKALHDEGKVIFQHLDVKYFDKLQLTLTNEIIGAARAERIKQVSNTNIHSQNQLWAAYLKGDDTNPEIIKDKSILLELAKKIAIIHHFQISI